MHKKGLQIIKAVGPYNTLKNPTYLVKNESLISL